MSDIIHLLPDSVANQIAAGEVIQRPASVIKELIENAIDAGATKIQVVVKGAGRTSIQVTDNGKGMSATDARMAFERHATSKISEATDLYALTTMGFRGEALASIAAVATVELRTRSADDEIGTLIEIAASKVERQESISTPIGTSFLVKNLFFNLPARRKFLKSDETELRQIIYEFQRIVLTYPDIHFELYNSEDIIYELTKSNLRQRIIQIFGKKGRNLNQQLVQIEVNTAVVNIYGFVGKPEYATKSGNQFFFVNGRYMRHPYFHRAVMQAYEHMLQPDTVPNYFIYFQIEPSTIDINIHPTKTEIKFEDEKDIWKILMICVKEALGKFNVIPSIDFNTDGHIEIPIPNKTALSAPPQPLFNPDYNPFNNTHSSNYQKNTPLHNWEQLYPDIEEEKEKELKIIRPLSGFSSEDGMLINQDLHSEILLYKGRYLITAVKSGLMLIDRQRAVERITYEQVLLQLEQQQSATQKLLFPEILKLSIDENLIFVQLIDDIKALGFDITPLEENIYEINGVPALLTNMPDSVSILHDMILSTHQKNLHVRTEIYETLAMEITKNFAKRLPSTLSIEEKSHLIDTLFGCQHPNITPDGKSIVTIITDDIIASYF